MRSSLAASTALHVGVLALTLVSFSGVKTLEPMTETVPVDVISASDYTKLTRGLTSGQKTDCLLYTSRAHETCADLV
ncbi:hypothetical protein LJE71_13215, partial [Xanthobacter autotrophicus]